MDRCVDRPSASMILTMEDKQVLVFSEKSISNKDSRSHSNRIRSNGNWPWCPDLQYSDSTHRGSLPHHRPSVSMIFTIVSIMGADGLAMKIKFQPRASAYPTCM